jgi:Uma2 family endonuclease
MTPTLEAHPRPEDPRLRRWSKAEYHEMADRGWFRNQRAELIEGEIVVLSPQKFEHGQVADRVTEILRSIFGADFWVRMQLPLDLGAKSEPEPDVSVVKGRREDYHEHPRTATLIVEVSDTTLAFDRGEKARVYASAGIADYWVLDLVHRQIHIYREPAPTTAGFEYRSILTREGSDTISPLAAPTASIAVAQLISPRP